MPTHGLHIYHEELVIPANGGLGFPTYNRDWEVYPDPGKSGNICAGDNKSVYSKDTSSPMFDPGFPDDLGPFDIFRFKCHYKGPNWVP